MSMIRTGACAAILFAAVTVPLHAQEAPAEAPPAQAAAVELETMQVTAGRQSESQYQVPQPVTVITREEIERENIQVMTEAFRYEPGAFFQQTGPGQGIVIVRGLKGAEVLHLVDGMRLNNAFFRTAPSQYIALVDPQNIEQLELLRGPYAALYGSDAMGGVVQVLTPEYRFDGDDWGWQAGGRMYLASADLAKIGRVYGATGMRGLSFALGASHADYGSRKLAEPGQSPDGAGTVTLADRVNDTAYTSHALDFKTLWEPGANQELMVSVQTFELPGLPRYNETVPGEGRPLNDPAFPPDAIQSVYFNDRMFYHLRYRYTAPLSVMDSLELHLARQDITDDRFNRTQPNPTTIRDTYEYQDSALSGFTAQAVSGMAEHRLVYGLELYRDDVSSSSIRINNGGAPIPNGTGGVTSRFPDGARTNNYGVYALDEWEFAESWKVDLGARYNRTDTHLPQADRAAGSEADVNSGNFTGSVGLRAALSPTLAWTSNIGRGYRVPNINDLANFGRSSNGRFNVPNTALKPETILSADTGLKWLSGPWQTETNVFYSQYTDRITVVNGAVAAGVGDCPATAGASGCSQSQNIAEADYYGFESGLRYRHSDGLLLRSVLNYTWGAQEVNGVRTPANRVPPLNGQLGAEYRVAAGWTLEPYVFFAGRQDRLDPTDLADHRINPSGTPGYAEVNLRMGWAPQPAYRLQLDFTNLLDKAYREHGSGIDAAAFGAALTAELRFE